MNKLAMALGTFDGLHRGHINVLNETKKINSDNLTPAVLLFDVHPQKALTGEYPPQLITLSEKEKLLNNMGITPCYINFSEIQNLSPEDFVRDILKGKFNCGAIVTGDNFRFGKNGEGNSKILCSLCKKYDIIYKVAENSLYKNELISATRIRKALENGEISDANRMLGRNFSYDFLVVEGNKIGKKYFGFPTINQHFPKGFIDLKHGVYASQTVVDGKYYPSVTNFGCHPTIGGDTVLSETCILGFQGDLYYQNIRVELLSFLRDEKKFSNRSELKKQIQKDSEQAVTVFDSIKAE